MIKLVHFFRLIQATQSWNPSRPRHITFDPFGKFVYVLNELTSTITVFAIDAETGKMQTEQTLSSLPENFKGYNSTAEISVDAKGKYLYASNRGDNSIGQFSINPNDGSLLPVDWISSGGKSPRHFEIDPTGKWLFAANQESGNIALYPHQPGQWTIKPGFGYD